MWVGRQIVDNDKWIWRHNGNFCNVPVFLQSLVSVRRSLMTGHIDLRSWRVRKTSESSEARDVHLQAIRSHHQSTRACTTPVLTPPVIGEEQRRLHYLSKELEIFRSEIIVSHINSCFSCHRLTYPQGWLHVTYETVEDLIAPLYSHLTTVPLPDVPEGECA